MATPYTSFDPALLALNIAKKNTPPVVNTPKVSVAPKSQPIQKPQAPTTNINPVQLWMDTAKTVTESQKPVKYLKKDKVVEIMKGLPDQTQRSQALDHLVSKGYLLEWFNDKPKPSKENPDPFGMERNNPFWDGENSIDSTLKGINEKLDEKTSKRDDISAGGYAKNLLLNVAKTPWNINELLNANPKDLVTGIKEGVKGYVQDVKDVYNRDPATGYGGFWSAAGKVLEDAGGAAYENPLDAALTFEWVWSTVNAAKNVAKATPWVIRKGATIGEALIKNPEGVINGNVVSARSAIKNIIKDKIMGNDPRARYTPKLEWPEVPMQDVTPNATTVSKPWKVADAPVAKPAEMKISSATQLQSKATGLDPRTVQFAKDNPSLMKAVREEQITEQGIKDNILEVLEDFRGQKNEVGKVYQTLYGSPVKFDWVEILTDIRNDLANKGITIGDNGKVSVDTSKTVLKRGEEAAINNAISSIFDGIRSPELSVEQMHNVRKNLYELRQYTDGVAKIDSKVVSDLVKKFDDRLKNQVAGRREADEVFSETIRTLQDAAKGLVNKGGENAGQVKGLVSLLTDANAPKLAKLESLFPWIEKQLRAIQANRDYIRSTETAKTGTYWKMGIEAGIAGGVTTIVSGLIPIPVVGTVIGAALGIKLAWLVGSAERLMDMITKNAPEIVTKLEWGKALNWIDRNKLTEAIKKNQDQATQIQIDRAIRQAEDKARAEKMIELEKESKRIEAEIRKGKAIVPATPSITPKWVIKNAIPKDKNAVKVVEKGESIGKPYPATTKVSAPPTELPKELKKVEAKVEVLEEKIDTFKKFMELESDPNYKSLTLQDTNYKRNAKGLVTEYGVIETVKVDNRYNPQEFTINGKKYPAGEINNFWKKITPEELVEKTRVPDDTGYQAKQTLRKIASSTTSKSQGNNLQSVLQAKGYQNVAEVPEDLAPEILKLTRARKIQDLPNERLEQNVPDAPMRSPVKESNPLLQEAKKYKSAEEFIDSLPVWWDKRDYSKRWIWYYFVRNKEPIANTTDTIKVYRGVPKAGNSNIYDWDYVTTNKAAAASYWGKVLEYEFPKNNLYKAVWKDDMIYYSWKTEAELKQIREEANKQTVNKINVLNDGSEITLVRGMGDDGKGYGEALRGKGLYLTDNPKVAKYYGKNLQEVKVKNSGILDGSTRIPQPVLKDLFANLPKDMVERLDYRPDATYNTLIDSISASSNYGTEEVAEAINKLLKAKYKGVRFEIWRVNDDLDMEGLWNENAFIIFGE